MANKHPQFEHHSRGHEFAGGPGASHKDAKQGEIEMRDGAESGNAKTATGERNPARSGVSGGGGEADSHHTHSEKLK